MVSYYRLEPVEETLGGLGCWMGRAVFGGMFAVFFISSLPLTHGQAMSLAFYSVMQVNVFFKMVGYPRPTTPPPLNSYNTPLTLHESTTYHTKTHDTKPSRTIPNSQPQPIPEKPATLPPLQRSIQKTYHSTQHQYYTGIRITLQPLQYIT